MRRTNRLPICAFALIFAVAVCGAAETQARVRVNEPGNSYFETKRGSATTVYVCKPDNLDEIVATATVSGGILIDGYSTAVFDVQQPGLPFYAKHVTADGKAFWSWEVGLTARIVDFESGTVVTIDATDPMVMGEAMPDSVREKLTKALKVLPIPYWRLEAPLYSPEPFTYPTVMP